MVRLLAVDPGTNALGWALFGGKDLLEAGLLRGKDVQDILRDLPSLPAHDNVIVEVPRIYPRGPARPNDLIGLAVVAGAAAARAPGDATFVFPHQWKGQVPKEIHHRRIFLQLADSELEKVRLRGVPKSLIHNVNDAIGLGLWAVGRM